MAENAVIVATGESFSFGWQVDFFKRGTNLADRRNQSGWDSWQRQSGPEQSCCSSTSASLQRARRDLQPPDFGACIPAGPEIPGHGGRSDPRTDAATPLAMPPEINPAGGNRLYVLQHPGDGQRIARKNEGMPVIGHQHIATKQESEAATSGVENAKQAG